MENTSNNNMNNHSIDEWKLTAYALGELDDPADIEAIKHQLETDEDAQRIVAEASATADLITNELQSESGLELTGEQRAEIKRTIAGTATGGSSFYRSRELWISSALTGLAACVVLTFFLPTLISRPRGNTSEFARTSPQDKAIAPPSAKRYASSSGKGSVASPSGERRDKAGVSLGAQVESEEALKPRGRKSAGGMMLGGEGGSADDRDRAKKRARIPKDIVDYPDDWPPLSTRRMDGSVQDADDNERWSGQRNTLGLTDQLFGDQPGEAKRQAMDRESYALINDNPFLPVTDEPLSTFSIDVDTASYSNIRRFIMEQGIIPPPDAVRIEEMVNYFDYDYEPPAADAEAPFTTHVEVAECPWNTDNQLAQIGLKGVEISNDDRPATNLVFLLDVSGSMGDRNKLPLVQQGMAAMVENLTVDDRVAIVTYAGDSRIALESTSCFNRDEILTANSALRAGGSTNGAAGIEQAYDIAARNFIGEGVNRVILCTDGDFNVGVSSNNDLVRLIEEKAETGVFLSVLGFGMGNYKDDKLELLADKGNGNYAYIDTFDEAYHVLVEKMAGTLVTIAKDVKIQVEFNPANVGSYRLIGYENRALRNRDFNDDTIDAGEIGAGHTVTALYELTPPVEEKEAGEGETDDLVYQEAQPTDRAVESNELFNLKLRYKAPDGDESQLIVIPVNDEHKSVADASDDFRLAAAVASYGMMLRNSPYRGQSSLEMILDLLGSARFPVDDAEAGRIRTELTELVEKTKRIAEGGSSSR